MILKYKVPKQYRKAIYDNKRIIYCEILQTLEISHSTMLIYKVKMLNYKNYTNIICSTELHKLNILDRFKLLFI